MVVGSAGAMMLLAGLSVFGLTACYKGLDEELGGIDDDGQVKNSVLQVQTRSGGSGDDAAVNYPVQVFVFEGDDCRAAQTIGDAGQSLSIALVEGTYTVYAVGGASATDYVVPAAADATATTALTLREGRSLGDLMSASATATLVDGGTNTVTLGMARKTMLVQDIVISKVPTAATAVSLTIAPLWQSLTVSGSYATTGASQTIALTRQSDNRTWRSTGAAYMLPPSSQPASVSVNITIGSATKTYTYSTADQLEAGYKIHIEGTYTEAVGVTLTGTLTGATWLGERTISFEFDEDGSSTAEPSTPSEPSEPVTPAAFPEAGDTYQGCHVLAAVVATDGESADLTLLSPNEQAWSGTVPTTSSLETAAATLGTDGISDWRPMTHDEALLLQAAHSALSIPNARYYLFDDNGTVKQMRMDNAAVSNATTAEAYIRPVAVVTVSGE